MTTDGKKKFSFDQGRYERSEKLQQTVMSLMIEVREMYSNYQEYATIIMNLTTVSKELNSIRIKEITGDVGDKAETEVE